MLLVMILTLQSIRGLEPNDAARKFWEREKNAVLAAMEIFHKGSVQYLLAERLSLTLSKSLPGLVSQGMLKEQRDALFGPPMRPKGAYRDILEALDRLAFLQMQDRRSGFPRSALLASRTGKV